MISFNIVLIRPDHVKESIKTMNHNMIIQGNNIQDEIRQLAMLCKETSNNIYISLYKKFSDGFYLYTIANSNKGILLYILTLQ